MPAKSHAKPPHDTPPAALREDGFVGTGHIWHTNGSGKTLPFFKAPSLVRENGVIHKCGFAANRKYTLLGRIFRSTRITISLPFLAKNKNVGTKRRFRKCGGLSIFDHGHQRQCKSTCAVQFLQN